MPMISIDVPKASHECLNMLSESMPPPAISRRSTMTCVKRLLRSVVVKFPLDKTWERFCSKLKTPLPRTALSSSRKFNYFEHFVVGEKFVFNGVMSTTTRHHIVF